MTYDITFTGFDLSSGVRQICSITYKPKGTDGENGKLRRRYHEMLMR